MAQATAPAANTKTADMIIEDGVREVLCDVTGKDPDEIQNTDRLGFELEIGKVIGKGEWRELQTKLEQKFGITIPNDIHPSLERLRHVRVLQVVRYIRDRVARNAA